MVHCAIAPSGIAVMLHFLFLPFFRLHLHLFCEYFLQLADKVLRNYTCLQSRKSAAGLGSASGAVYTLRIFFIKCVNHKNQEDSIIDPVCSLFSDRGAWEPAFRIMCTSIELRELTCLNRTKKPNPGLSEFYFL